MGCISAYAAVLAAALGVAPLAVYAEDALFVSVEQDEYYYGEQMTFSITVPDASQGTALVLITDSEGITGSPIPIAISEEVTRITAPNPFDSIIYGTGMYMVSVEYGGDAASVTFELKSQVPEWFKRTAEFWMMGETSDSEFAGAIEYLASRDIMMLPETVARQDRGTHEIPDWVRSTTGAWVGGALSNDKYAVAIGRLVDAGVLGF